MRKKNPAGNAKRNGLFIGKHRIWIGFKKYANVLNLIQFCIQDMQFEMEKEEFGRIFEEEAYAAICNGEVIEEYPEDNPYPSVLIYGRTTKNRPLHMVCAYNQTENFAIVVTVYHPNPELWIDYKRRKKA